MLCYYHHRNLCANVFLEEAIATIREVAEQAGVSISTVSHVLNRTRFVSDELSEKVMSVVDSLDYQPNLIARSLRKQQTNSLGLIVADISNPFFSEFARQIEYLSHLKGYSVFLCNSDGDAVKEEFYIQRLSEWRVDGILLVSSTIQPSRLNSLGNHNTTMILVDMDYPGYTMDSISIHNVRGGRTAVNHLIGLGHRRIGCIAGIREYSPSLGRVDGYRFGLKEAGIEVDESLVFNSDFNADSGYNAAIHLLSMEDPPTAIFATCDLMAIGAMQAAYQRGLRIPDDLSVIGFDDINHAQYTIPPLTTIRQPIRELVDEALNCFFERLDDQEKAFRSIRLDVKLIERESTSKVNMDLKGR